MRNLRSDTAAITAACDAFEATFDPQICAKGQSVAKNAELKVIAHDIMTLKAQANQYIKNYTGNNPGARAAWRTAAHVEKAPSKKKDNDDNGGTPTP